jgi:hypothetical protein
VPRKFHSEQALHDVRDLSKPIQEELEKFFIATDELKNEKLEIIGWKGKGGAKGDKGRFHSVSPVSRG